MLTCRFAFHHYLLYKKFCSLGMVFAIVENKKGKCYNLIVCKDDMECGENILMEIKMLYRPLTATPFKHNSAYQ